MGGTFYFRGELFGYLGGTFKIKALFLIDHLLLIYRWVFWRLRRYFSFFARSIFNFYWSWWRFFKKIKVTLFTFSYVHFHQFRSSNFTNYGKIKIVTPLPLLKDQEKINTPFKKLKGVTLQKLKTKQQLTPTPS